MKIHVEDKLYIESDDMQYILKQYSGKFDKEGKETYKTLGYFPTLQQVVKHLIKLNIMKSNAETLKELLEDITRIEKRIKELIKY
jgi:hypothetical protein